MLNLLSIKISRFARNDKKGIATQSLRGNDRLFTSASKKGERILPEGGGNLYNTGLTLAFNSG